ncbi:hypothetical protein KC19_10G015400 [Ceratodon purpureus]|uniref:Uncharacterized protein n=1 Tax=Ceratodon purpureus TaxID=3225 RepID=A0A8T0GKM5_CERPU|nr:hypothetical protein KC19_10G015400 [Ceratodon purpureus]
MDETGMKGGQGGSQAREGGPPRLRSCAATSRARPPARSLAAPSPTTSTRMRLDTVRTRSPSRPSRPHLPLRVASRLAICRSLCRENAYAWGWCGLVDGEN